MTQKELGYVELEWTCKRCGTINPGMQRVCTNCGAPMGKDDKFDLPDEQILITEQEKLEEAKAEVISRPVWPVRLERCWAHMIPAWSQRNPALFATNRLKPMHSAALIAAAA